MAVELRCPDCRAKLRLAEAPDAGTEVECPKCGTVFAAPEPDAVDEDAPKKKKKPARGDADDDSDEKPKKGAKNQDDSDDEDDKKKKEKKPKKAKGAADANPNAPKRRKAKKNKTSNTALIAVLGAGLLLLLCVGGVLIWFFSRTAKSVEMMYYLPEDCNSVEGLNLGHAQKYPELYKSVSATFKDTEFKAAGDALAKALGSADIDAIVDYIVFGSSKSGSAVVLHTKSDIEPEKLAKLPGAEPKTLGGKTYYLASAFKGSAKVRVFAPTSRLIVYCPASTAELSDAVFQKMLDGHSDSKEKTIGVRAGPLGKRVTKGTFWFMRVYEADKKPPAVAGGPPPDDPDGKLQLGRTIAETTAGSSGMGYKASIGSREVRFEVVVWCSDSEKAGSLTKKWKESELGKGDDGTPPRWWKTEVEGLGNKKIAAQLLANLGFGSSGELFYAKSAVETGDLKDAINTLANKVNPAPAPGGPAPGGPAPGGPAPGGPPPKAPRRREWARR